jgi:hypothetical protein
VDHWTGAVNLEKIFVRSSADELRSDKLLGCVAMFALGTVLLTIGSTLLLCSAIFALASFHRPARRSLAAPVSNDTFGAYQPERVAYFIDQLREERDTRTV